MYGHHQAVSLPGQISGREDDASASAAAGHIVYGDAEGVAVDEIGPPESMYVHGTGQELVSHGHDGSDLVARAPDDSDMVVRRAEGTSQLTLSFRGQVYVFDAVSPEKVEAVLSLLGGCTELSSGAQGMDVAQQHMGMVDYPSRCNLPQRAASLDRFRQKRKERCFDKKVRYSVRQEVALRMRRNKGQFTSSKKTEGAYNSGTDQESGHDDGQTEASCTHCGTSSKCTPMMRRGPSGPRTLCNACGLFWANRGALRDLSKKTDDHPLTMIKQSEGEAEANNSKTGNAIQGQNSLVSFPNGGNPTLIPEH